MASSQPRGAQHLRSGWVVALALVLIFAVDSYGTYVFFTSRVPSSNDFYSRWAGAKIFLLEGKNPYSEEATREIQQGIYGRLSKEGEDQVAFAYPMYVVYLVFPLIFLPYTQAQAVWLALLQFALLLGLFLVMRVVSWRPPTWLFVATCVWSVFFYYHARSILLGQFAVIVFALLAIVLWALWTSRFVWAGVCLALTTVKPQMVFLVVPLLLIWAIARRRWSLVISFAVSMILLVGSTLLLVPGWIGEFFAWMSRYPSYTALGSPVWILTEYYFTFLGRPVHVAVSAALLAYLFWIWRRVSTWTWPELLWGISLALIVTNLIAVRTATTNYVVLLVPLVILFRDWTARLSWGSWAVLIFELCSLIMFWALFAATVVNRFEHPLMYLPVPFLLLLVFVVDAEALCRPEAVQSRPESAA